MAQKRTWPALNLSGFTKTASNFTQWFRNNACPKPFCGSFTCTSDLRVCTFNCDCLEERLKHEGFDGVSIPQSVRCAAPRVASHFLKSFSALRQDDTFPSPLFEQQYLALYRSVGVNKSLTSYTPRRFGVGLVLDPVARVQDGTCSTFRVQVDNRTFRVGGALTNSQ